MFHSPPPPLKTSERRTLSDIFRGYRRGELVENGQNNFTKIYQKVFHIDWKDMSEVNEKQPPEIFYEKVVLKIFRNIHIKALVLESFI